MKRHIINKLLVLSLLGIGLTLYAEKAAKLFRLARKSTKKGEFIKITNGVLSVQNRPGRVSFKIMGPYGNFNGVRSYYLDSIKVIKDTDEEKCVELTSVRSKHHRGYGIFSLRFTAKRNQPGIEIVYTIKNPKKQQKSLGRRFSFCLSPLSYPYYYDPDGWQIAGKPELTDAKWLYLPSAGTKGGYGIIPLNIHDSRILTRYPRKDWLKWGLFIATSIKPRQLFPGEESSIGLYIFPAASQWELVK